jgi:hypothetical protein
MVTYTTTLTTPTVTIGELPTQTTVLDTTFFPAETSNITQKVTAQSLKAYMSDLSQFPIATGGVTATYVNSPIIGNVGTALVGTLLTSAQPNITSVGALAQLEVDGNLYFKQIGDNTDTAYLTKTDVSADVSEFTVVIGDNGTGSNLNAISRTTPTDYVAIRTTDQSVYHLWGTDGSYIAGSRITAPVINVTNQITAPSATFTQLNVAANTAFANLAVSGTIVASKILASEGAGTSCGFSFSQDFGQDTGMFSPSDGLLQFYANGVDVFDVTSGGVTFKQAVNLGSSIVSSGLLSINTAYGGSPINYDSQEAVAWVNSNNVAGLSFSPTDNRVLSIGIGPDNHAFLRTGANQFDLLAGTLATQTIVPLANLSYNLGSTTAWWGTMYGTSTMSLYADLAEVYASDFDYAPGTVVSLGGSAEITVSELSHDYRVLGVISTAPGYVMNAAAAGLPVALKGRVPCKVTGPVKSGDRLVNAGDGTAIALDMAKYSPGCVIGHSLGDVPGGSVLTVEVFVTKF